MDQYAAVAAVLVLLAGALAPIGATATVPQTDSGGTGDVASTDPAPQAADGPQSATASGAPTVRQSAESEMAPGQRLAGSIGAHRAELEGDVETRRLAIRLEGAATADAEASIVADRVAEIEVRIDALEARLAALEAARENGSMSAGEYRARRAIVAAEAEGLLAQLKDAESVTVSLSTSLLLEYDLELEEIRSLADRARALADASIRL